jgi:hypothetical protein
MKSKNEEYYLKEIASIFEELYKIANYGNILSDKINSDNANSNLSSNLLRSYIDYSKKTIKIEKIRNGSIEIILSGLSLVSAIAIPIALYLVQKQDLEEISMHFIVNSKDPIINDILDKVESGFYGDRKNVEKYVFRILAEYGYSTEYLHPYSYRVSKAIESSKDRIIRILRI